MYIRPDAKLLAGTVHLAARFREAMRYEWASWRHFSDEFVKSVERLSSSDNKFQWFRRPDERFQQIYPGMPTIPAAPTGTSFRLVSMRPEYFGEHLPGNIIYPGKKVKYLTDPEERKRFRIQIIDGKIYDAKGKLFDTTKTSMGDHRDAIFVMDKEGVIYASRMSMPGKFHHSSFLAGEPVAGAGTIRVENGELQRLTDRSGHYHPERSFTRQVMDQLRSQGIMMEGVSIDMRAHA